MSNASSTPLLLNDLASPRLQTTVPSEIRRRVVNDGASFSAASTLRGSRNKKLTSPDFDLLPNGWKKISHPDSGVYYSHEEKGVLTSSNVLDSKVRTLALEAAGVLDASPALQALREDQEVNVVVDVRNGNGSTRTSYYCVSHVERRVFWLEGIGHEEVDIPCTSNKCRESQGSRVHCIEAQYWKHCELFPSTFAVTKEVTRVLKGALLQAAADRLLVKFSTSPFNKEALDDMISIVKEIEADLGNQSGYAAWIVARFMALYNDGVLRSSYGQGDDFFDIEDTGPAIGEYRRPFLLTVFAPFFLKSPDVYAVELHSFHENFTPERWSNFVHKVDQSIRDSNLLATVLLSTNAGLLAWTGGANADGINRPRPEQIVSYVSIICSIGSIIVGLAIFKQYRAKGADTPLRAVIVLRRILKEPFGLERLAIICSLPYVLLMWGLITFLASFSIIFYRETGIDVRIPVTLTLGVVAFSIFFCLYTAGPPEKEDEKVQKRSRKEETLPKV